LRVARAFSPGHITGFFQICDDSKDPLFNGSRGAGFSVDKGVTTTVHLLDGNSTENHIRINGHPTRTAPVSQNVITALRALAGNPRCLIEVEHDVALPIGSGFGTSGAGALSLAFAMNEVFGLGLSNVKAAQIAHTAELACRTGMGTVIAETVGGIEIRVRPGAPGIGEIRVLPQSPDYIVICLPFGPLPTPKFLTNARARRRINERGGLLTDALLSHPTVPNLLAYSRGFAEHVELITDRVRRVLQSSDQCGVTCSTAIFGENVFTLATKDHEPEVEAILKDHLRKPRQLLVMNVDCQGARMLDE
jgi:pantoate kinase